MGEKDIKRMTRATFMKVSRDADGPGRGFVYGSVTEYVQAFSALSHVNEGFPLRAAAMAALSARLSTTTCPSCGSIMIVLVFSRGTKRVSLVSYMFLIDADDQQSSPTLCLVAGCCALPMPYTTTLASLRSMLVSLIRYLF